VKLWAQHLECFHSFCLQFEDYHCTLDRLPCSISKTQTVGSDLSNKAAIHHLYCVLNMLCEWHTELLALSCWKKNRCSCSLADV
jgi:hypothetical protein